MTVHLRANIGSGDHPLNYWQNVDCDPEMPAQIHALVPPMPFEDEELEHIWACHFLEHLDYTDGAIFLAECYRCLKPGGRLGVVVPDTKAIMLRWLQQTGDCMYIKDEWRCVNDLDDMCHVFLYSDIQETPHQWSYEPFTLARAMTEAGFEKLHEIDKYQDLRIAAGVWFQCGWDGYRPERGNE